MGEAVKADFEVIGEMVRSYKSLCFEFPHVITKVGNFDSCKCSQKQGICPFLKYFEKAGI